MVLVRSSPAVSSRAFSALRTPCRFRSRYRPSACSDQHSIVAEFFAIADDAEGSVSTIHCGDQAALVVQFRSPSDAMKPFDSQQRLRIDAAPGRRIIPVERAGTITRPAGKNMEF